MAPGLVGGDSRYRPPPLTMGDRGEWGTAGPPRGFLPSEEDGWASSRARESMMSWRSFSMELTMALCSDWTRSPGAGEA